MFSFVQSGNKLKVLLASSLAFAGQKANFLGYNECPRPSNDVVAQMNQRRMLLLENELVGVPAVDNKSKIIRNEFIAEFQQEPMSETEADSALEMFANSPDLVDMLIRPVLPPDTVVDVDQLMHHVRSIVLNKRLLSDVYDRMEQKQHAALNVVSNQSQVLENAVAASVQHYDVPITPSHNVQESAHFEAKCKGSKSCEWENIVDSSRCSVCCDLLVAPHVLECHHSFCWECLHNLEMCSVSQKSSNAVEEDVEELLSCPECRKMFTCSDAIFELRLDQMIMNAVNKCPSCPEKEEWMARRTRYESMRSSKKTAPAKSEYEFTASEEADDAQDFFDESVFLPAVFAMVMSVVMIVFYVRRGTQ